MSRLIQLIDLSLYFNEKICFETFNFTIHENDRIALIGDNGSGKSSMLKIISKLMPPSDGYVHYCNDLKVAYVPQLIDTFEQNSGAEKFNRALSTALAQCPDLLLLDEPTNHLDCENRKGLMHLLHQYSGALIIASHDIQLLRHNDYSFWDFDQGTIEVYQGNIDHYFQHKKLQRSQLESEIDQINHQKKQIHFSLMKEQKRAKSSRLKGEKSIKQAKWPTIVSDAKARRAQETSGKKKHALMSNKEDLMDQLQSLSHYEEIIPKFDLTLSTYSNKALITINNGMIGYDTQIILNDIELHLSGCSRLAIKGSNGSGKSTILKAIMQDSRIQRHGSWIVPSPQDIGYLDQHYQGFNNDNSVLEVIQKCRPDWTYSQLRHHLNDFLFRKNEQVNNKTSCLSGGEKARLSLARIAAKPPKLLILDEVTNNLDLRTRNHVISVLKNYPGPFIVVSHDEDFLDQIEITHYYTL